MIIVGVDPGEHGAVAILNTYKFNDTVVFPFAHNSMESIFQLLSEIRGGEIASRTERISANLYSSMKGVMPNKYMSPPKAQDNMMEIWLEEPGIIQPPRFKKDAEGKASSTVAAVAATRSLAKHVGVWTGIGIALATKVNYVPPIRWQTALKCKTKGNKNISKNLAKNIFWALTSNVSLGKITHDTADALLVALYGYTQYADRSYWPARLKEHIPLA